MSSGPSDWKLKPRSALSSCIEETPMSKVTASTSATPRAPSADTMLEKRSWISVSRPSDPRSEEHTSELQSLMRISYAVFCLKKKKNKYEQQATQTDEK